MELTDDLVAIQGILMSVIKTTGEFTKINYRGGNEEKILKIIEEIQKHIMSKNYIKDGRINKVFDKNVEDIVLFLTINTKYKNPLMLEDYDHLINIMPQLSKCILINIIYGLDLCKYFCKALEKLPLTYVVELLDETLPCLKKSYPDILLRYATMLLRTTAMILSTEISEKEEDSVNNLVEVTNIILQYLTGIHPGSVKNLKAAQIYQHMGYSLLNLFDLLLYCDKSNPNLKKFIDNVLRTSCTIVKSVTITIFCSWVEINEDDEPLQSVVSGKAYQVVEEYQKYKEAKELISMLGAIARKPKTLTERIQAADTKTIIKKVYTKDPDQKSWFQALVTTQVFANKDATRCVGAWAQLCDKNDVSRLINLSYQSKDDEAKQLALKCASTLVLDELIYVTTRFFYENKFNGLVSDVEKVESQLQLIFNKTSSASDTGEDFVKELYLLVLQSPKTVLKGVYGECLRSKCYAKCYEKFFGSIKEIVNINDFGTDILWQTVSTNLPDAQNVDNYVALLSVLAQVDCLSTNQIINSLMLPLNQFLLEKKFEQLGFVLQILLDCSFKIPATSQMAKVRWALLTTMNESRCTFLDLDPVKQQTANYAVDVVKNLCEVHPSYNFEEESQLATATTQNYDQFTNYYKSYLSCKNDLTLLRTLYSNFSVANYEECVSRVLRFLPRAVTNEWTNIFQEIFFLCGSEKAMELLTDVMILLCKVVDTQNPTTNTGKQVVVALRYCLQQYGNALQEIQADSVEEMEVIIARNICRLLKHLPETVKEQEGLSIVNVLTQRALKSLSNNREFVCLVMSINNSAICRVIKQRMVD